MEVQVVEFEVSTVRRRRGVAEVSFFTSPSIYSNYLLQTSKQTYIFLLATK
jgi:hypothetical protein